MPFLLCLLGISPGGLYNESQAELPWIVYWFVMVTNSTNVIFLAAKVGKVKNCGRWRLVEVCREDRWFQESQRND